MSANETPSVEARINELATSIQAASITLDIWHAREGIESLALDELAHQLRNYAIELRHVAGDLS